MVLGIALALFLEKPVRGMRLFRTIFVLPMMIAPICVGLIWRYLFDANFGPINLWLGSLGLAPHLWLAEPGLAFTAMVITDIWQWTPFVLIMVLAGLQGLDSSVMEAARIDGANWWQQIVRVKLPMIKPILVVTLLVSGFVLYSLEHTTRGLERRIAKLDRGISEEIESTKWRRDSRSRRSTTTSSSASCRRRPRPRTWRSQSGPSPGAPWRAGTRRSARPA